MVSMSFIRKNVLHHYAMIVSVTLGDFDLSKRVLGLVLFAFMASMSHSLMISIFHGSRPLNLIQGVMWLAKICIGILHPLTKYEIFLFLLT